MDENPTLSGSYTASSLQLPGAPPVAASRTEGPLGDFLKNLLGNSVPGIDPPQQANPLVDCLKELVRRKYGLILAYIYYGDQLRAFHRDGIFHHFQEHLEEERKLAYELNKKITALGDDAPCEPTPVPHVPLNDTKAVVTALLQMEQESVQLWNKVFCETQNDAALNGLAQQGAQTDQAHADDMARYLRGC